MSQRRIIVVLGLAFLTIGFWAIAIPKQALALRTSRCLIFSVICFGEPAPTPTPTPTPTSQFTFRGALAADRIVIAPGSVTIRYDPRLEVVPPPGFAELLGVEFDESY